MGPGIQSLLQDFSMKKVSFFVNKSTNDMYMIID